MTKLKLLFAGLLSLVLMIVFSSTLYADTQYIESPWIYSIDPATDSVIIEKYIGSESSCEVPWSFAGMEVKEIESNAFEGTSVQSVKLPDNNIVMGNLSGTSISIDTYSYIEDPIEEPGSPQQETPVETNNNESSDTTNVEDTFEEMEIGAFEESDEDIFIGEEIDEPIDENFETNDEVDIEIVDDINKENVDNSDIKIITILVLVSLVVVFVIYLTCFKRRKQI